MLACAITWVEDHQNESELFQKIVFGDLVYSILPSQYWNPAPADD